MSHDLDLARLIRITDGFIPVMFDENLLRLDVERDRSVATVAVLIALGCKSFQDFAEFPAIKVRRQSRFANGIPGCIVQLGSFRSPFIAFTVIANRYLRDAASLQQIRELEYFYLPFLIFGHAKYSFFFFFFRTLTVAVRPCARFLLFPLHHFHRKSAELQRHPRYPVAVRNRANNSVQHGTELQRSRLEMRVPFHSAYTAHGSRSGSVLNGVITQNLRANHGGTPLEPAHLRTKTREAGVDVLASKIRLNRKPSNSESIVQVRRVMLQS